MSCLKYWWHGTLIFRDKFVCHCVSYVYKMFWIITKKKKCIFPHKFICKCHKNKLFWIMRNASPLLSPFVVISWHFLMNSYGADFFPAYFIIGKTFFSRFEVLSWREQIECVRNLLGTFRNNDKYFWGEISNLVKKKI